MASLLMLLGLVVVSGLAVMRIIAPKISLGIAEKLAFSYCLGMGFVSMQTFIYLFFSLPVTMMSLVVPWLALGILGALTCPRKRHSPEPERREERRYSNLELFLIGALALEVSYLFFRAILVPMDSFDAVVIWAFRAKAIWYAGGITHEIFQNPVFYNSHTDYPLLIPIQEALYYFLNGRIDDGLVKSIFPLYYLSLIVIFFSLLKRVISVRSALLFTFLLGTVPFLCDYATNGYVDFVVGVYYGAGFLSLYLWYLRGELGFLALSAILSAIGAWSKNEGLALCLANLLIALVMVRSKKRGRETWRDIWQVLCYFGIALALFVVPWIIFKYAHHLTSDLATTATFSIKRAIGNLDRLPVIFYEYQKQFLGFKKWNLFWVLFFSLFIAYFRKAFSKKIFPVTAAVMAPLAIYTLIYIVTPKDFQWHISTTAARLILHAAPVVAFWCALMAKEANIKI